MTDAVQQTWSIRQRVLISLFAGMALVISATLWTSYFTNREAADSAYDRLLLASASAIAERTVVRGKEVTVDIPYVALDMLASTAQDRVFYAVLAPSGDLVTGYDNLPGPPSGARPRQDRATDVYDAQYKGVPVRILSLQSFVSGANLSGYVTIRVAQTRGERESLTFLLLQQSAAWTILIVVAGAAAAWFGISNGLRPLDRLQEALGRRSPEDIRPILHDVPAEFVPLVQALNGMLSRLDTGLTAMRRFISDASHQLKTPLAGLQTQTQMALRETDPDALHTSLEKVDISVRRTTRLAQQLLSHARATEKRSTFETVSVAPLVRDVIGQLSNRARERHIDLGCEGEEGLNITGSPILLQELLMNVTDNAICYTWANTAVTVRFFSQENHTVIQVIDEGPGIPPAEREAVFGRFVRLSSNHEEGCGLGLAIAREIIEQFHGQITLQETAGGGLTVHMTFPKGETIS